MISKPSLPIRITTLGRVEVTAGNIPVESLRQQPTRCALLIYLAIERKVSRDAVLDMFWPDSSPDRGRNVLNQNLYRLRQALGREWVTNRGGMFEVMEDVTCDAVDLESAVVAGRFEEAVRLYAGPFLLDFALPAITHYERWTSTRRTRMEGLHRRAQRGVIDPLLDAGDTSSALAVALAWAEIVPLEDEAQHLAIELLHRQGRNSEALARFEQYRTQLRAELDLDPMEETVQLVERIACEQRALPPVSSVETPPNVEPNQETKTRTNRSWPHWRRTTWWVTPAGVATMVLALLAVAWRLLWSGSASESDPTVVAVVRFEDVGVSNGLPPLGPGLTEQLVLDLSRVPSLSVIPITGTIPGREQESPEQTAKSLGAATLVSGIVERSQGRIRVTYQLVNANDGRVIQSGRVERPLGELFELYDLVGADLLRLIREHLGRWVEERRQLASHPSLEAYLLVQRAGALEDSIWQPGTRNLRVRRRTALLTLLAADTLLAQAEVNDRSWTQPTIRRGWNARERARITGTADRTRYQAFLAEALRHAERAVRLRPDNAEALELRGTIRMQIARVNNLDPTYSTNMRAAEADLRRAIAIDPNLASALATLSRIELYSGDVDEAAVLAQRALEADPFLLDGAEIIERLFHTYLDSEVFAEAGAWCQRGRRDFPHDWRFVECELALAGWDPQSRVSPEAALALLDTLAVIDPAGEPVSYQPYYRTLLYAKVLARSGKSDSARSVLYRVRRELRGRPELYLAMAFDAAALDLALGDTADALDELDRYVQGNPQHRDFIRSDFAFRPLRNHPRFRSIVQAPARR